MKKLLFLLLIVTEMANAQIVTIADPVFKAKLLSANSSNQIASTATPVYDFNTGQLTASSYNSIDINNDGDIQASEALLIKYLNVSGVYNQNGNINDLTGIEYFTNIQVIECRFNQLTSINVSNNTALRFLHCSQNQLTSLNVSSNTALKLLNCGSNQLTSLNVSSNTVLEELYCFSNQLTSLDVSSNTVLEELYCFSNQLTSLNVDNNTALRYLDCSSNQITSLNVSSNTALTDLYCGNNQLTSLDVNSNTALTNLSCYYNQLTGLNVNSNTALAQLSCDYNQLTSLDVSSNTALTFLVCNTNQLTSLDVSSNTALTNLDCSSNQLTSLNVSNNTALTLLFCNNNQLTSLDVSSNTALTNLACGSNQLTSLNVSNNVALWYLGCNLNQLTTLDVSSNTALTNLYCNNNQLTSLFIKNGRVENTLIFGNNPNLIYICADEAQISSVQAQAGANVVVSSYCSFTPGGTYNTVSGTVRFDANNNGCDSNDSVLPNSVHLNVTDGTVSSGTFPTTNGSYLLYTLTGTNTLSTALENPSYFTITPTTSTITTTTLGITQTQDFCITANGVHNDVEVVIVPITTARPGFDAKYKVVYKNKGNQTLSGAVNFNYNDAVLDYFSSSVNPNTQSTGNLTWNYSNLLPFETRSFNVILNVNAPTETPAVNIDDVLDYSATINPVSGDETTTDNVFVYSQTVVGAYDPNDKTCLEGAIVSPTKIGDYLHYNINFENTGNATAQNIVVKDIIDTIKFDVNSLQIMDSSHPMTAKMSGNKVEFVFQNINLGASQHGNVTFKIKTLNSLAVGSSVTNKADIYFDYNFPVATNTATTTFQTLSSGEFTLDNSVKVYPNPSNSKVNINANNNIKSIQLFDIQGRILTTKIIDDSQSNFDISTYSNGVYFIKITTEKGSKVEKIIKE